MRKIEPLMMKMWGPAILGIGEASISLERDFYRWMSSLFSFFEGLHEPFSSLFDPDGGIL
jgi:hypothetical protein